MKGHYNSGNSKGRKYAIMMFLSFGAAILGVMVLHKLRERRIFSLLVKEKDHQLISLHLLLQKERDHNKEAERKIEEMKAKMYSIRTQKMELDGRILEMQSTISSLKDEQKTLETALEEKQNESKFLQGKETEQHDKNPQLLTLMETLKQYESQIKELKQRLENATKIWSVSTDDPSNLALNSTNYFQHQAQEEEMGYEKSGDRVEGTKAEGLTLNELKGNPNTNETLANTEAKSAKEEEISKKGQMGNQLVQGNDEGQQTEMNSRGGMKLEIEKSSSGGDGAEKDAYTNDTKEKRWRLGAKQENREGAIRNRRYNKNGKQSGKYKRIVDEELQKLGTIQSKVETGTSKHVKNELSQNTDMGENSKIGVIENRAEINYANKHFEEVQRNKTVDVLNNATAAAENNKKPCELELSEKNVNGIQVQLDTNDKSIHQSTEEERITDKNGNGVQVPLETNDDETIEQSTEENLIDKNGEAEREEIKEAEEAYGESKAELEEDKGHGVKTEEPEF